MERTRRAWNGIPLISWWILALMTFDYALAMIDRNVVSILKTTLKGVFEIDDSQYGLLVTAFMVPYALLYVVSGLVADRIGSRLGFTLFIGVWSIATIAAGLSHSFPELLFWRFVLGAAEAGLLPCTMIALVAWFPRDRMALAYAVKTPLQSFGPIVSAPLIAWLALSYGWRMAFIVPGAVGLMCAVLWWFSDRNSPDFGGKAVAAAEAAGAPRVERKPILASLRELLSNRVMLTIVLARLISDPVWFFFQYWQAGYLQEELGVSLAGVGKMLWIPPAICALLTFGTALWSDRLIAAKRSPAFARLVVLGSTTVLAPLLLILPFTREPWLVVAVLTATYFMCFTWLYLTNILTADLFPKGSTGAAVGLIGTIGTVGAAVFNWAAGYVIEAWGYVPIFILCALLHPAALALLWFRLGRRAREVA